MEAEREARTDWPVDHVRLMAVTRLVQEPIARALFVGTCARMLGCIFVPQRSRRAVLQGGAAAVAQGHGGAAVEGLAVVATPCDGAGLMPAALSLQQQPEPGSHWSQIVRDRMRLLQQCLGATCTALTTVIMTALIVCAVLCCAVLCCAVLCCAVLCCAVLCCAVLCCVVLCCAVLCCAVLCCAVLCCAVLCCAVLCCAVLCCAVLLWRRLAASCGVCRGHNHKRDPRRCVVLCTSVVDVPTSDSSTVPLSPPAAFRSGAFIAGLPVQPVFIE
jgi:hypothetical protein